MTTHAAVPGARQVEPLPIARAALLAALGAAALNAALYQASVAAGIFPRLPFFPAGPGEPMTLGPVLLVSVVAALAGVGVFAVLRRRTRQPFRAFAAVAGVVLLVSFAAPVAMPGWTGAQAGMLNLMHALVAAAVLLAVRRVAETQPG